MKSSASSSATATNPSSAGPPPNTFALSGRSVALDPRIHAVRGDLADIRLAGQVFAPHYAVPMSCIARQTAAVREARDPASATVASLAPGDEFEVLELAGALAWGIAPGSGLVGYVDRRALDRAG